MFAGIFTPEPGQKHPQPGPPQQTRPVQFVGHGRQRASFDNRDDLLRSALNRLVPPLTDRQREDAAQERQADAKKKDSYHHAVESDHA